MPLDSGSLTAVMHRMPAGESGGIELGNSNANGFEFS
jgi:hypothetical protein